MIKISVVTVTYNCADTVRETLQSVLSQDYPNLDYVVIDGASKDETCSIIKNEQSRIQNEAEARPLLSFKFISEPDKGIFDAMNKSLDYVAGDYVLFMNAGDKFVNCHVVSDIFANTNHNEDLIYGDTYVQNSLGMKLGKADAIYLKNPSAFELVFGSQGFCHQSLFTKTDVLRDIKFNLRYPLGADYDTTAKVHRAGNHQLFYTGFPIAIFDDRTGGASHNRLKKVIMERVEMFGLKKDLHFYVKLYGELWRTNIKQFIMTHFAFFVDKYRQHKYVAEVDK